MKGQYTSIIILLFISVAKLSSEQSESLLDEPTKAIIIAPDLTQTILAIAITKYLKTKASVLLHTNEVDLVPLLKRCSHLDAVITTNDALPAQPVQYLSITDLIAQYIPPEIPYLIPDPALVTYWRMQLQHEKKFNIGIAFAKTKNPIFYDWCTNIAQNTTINLYCLQSVTDLELSRIPHSMRFINTNNRNVYETYAAFIKNLDLIISEDAAMAYMAGALGKPVWLITSSETILPWIDDPTVWYPTMRIWRYTQENHNVIMEQFAQEIEALIQ